jgi:nucleotide sugar dehydrogenase
LSFIVSAAQALRPALHPAMVVILESTTYPGTTRELLLPDLEATGLRVGQDLFVAFSPERVDPGRSDWTTKNTPKVIGGITPACTAVAAAMYEGAMDTVVRVSSSEVAEMTKLLENTFRAVNIAMVNEMALMCDRLGLDVWEVIEAASTKPFGFMRFLPGPGLGGHCIPIDPLYLSWKMKSIKYNARIIDLASEINTNMPRYVVEKAQDVLNQRAKAMRGARMLVVGVAYKPDISDTRESPGLDVIELLRGKGAEVSYYDPFVPAIEHEGWGLTSVPDLLAEARRADCVIIITHRSSIDYAALAEAPTGVRHPQRHRLRRDPRSEGHSPVTANYLVTGAAGFIGAALSGRLLDDGHRVTGIDNLNDAYDLRLKEWRLARLRQRPGFTFQRVDIADRRALETAFAGEPFDAVFNLAARAGVRLSLKQPAAYYETNVTGALNLLEAARARGVPKFVQASTSSLYGAHNPRPFSETADTSRPLSPYAASKGAAELLCHTYHHLYGLDVTVLRYFTVYGPAGRPDMSLFRFIQWISEDRPVRLYGDGLQERDFTYCDDIVEGTIAAARPLGFEIINLGSDQPASMLDVIQRLGNCGPPGRPRSVRAPGDVAARADVCAPRRCWPGRPGRGSRTACPLRRVVPCRAVVEADDRHDGLTWGKSTGFVRHRLRSNW